MNSLSRRNFLRKSGLAVGLGPALVTGGFSLLPRKLRAAEPGANDKIRLGVIGCGARGRDILGVFLSNKEVDCAVVCDVDDKMLAKTIDEGRAMLEAAQRHQRVVQMGTQWRSGSHQKEAVDFVRSGKLGKIGIVRGWVYLDWLTGIGKPSDCAPPSGVDYDMWLGPAPARPFNPNRFHYNFRWFWDYAGGLMTDWGVHLMNVMFWAMGPDHPKSISSTGGIYVLNDNRETPDTQI